MSSERRFAVSAFRDARDVIPRPRQLTLLELAQRLAPSHPPVRADLVHQTRRRVQVVDRALAALLEGGRAEAWLEDHPTFRALERVAWTAGASPEAVRAALDAKAAELREAALRQLKTRLPCWSPAHYRRGATRGLAGVESLSCLVLDYDDGTDIEAATAPWQSWALMVHTSWSHTTEHPRFRLVLPLAEAVPATAWEGVWRWAAARSAGTVDPACKDPSRLYLLPAKESAESPYTCLSAIEDRPLLCPERTPADIETPVAPRLERRTWTPRPPMDPLRACARRILVTDRAARERAGRWLDAQMTPTRAERIPCPRCERSSVWFWLSPGTQSTARCSHKNSCGWWGHLDELLDIHRSTYVQR